MRRLTVLLVGVLLVGGGAWLAAAWHWRWRPFHQPDTPPTPRAKGLQITRYALLVGCTKYPNVKDRKRWLRAAPNDVALLQRVLRDRYEVKNEDIKVLMGDAELEAEKDDWPSRANIEKAFSELAEKVKEGDQVLIWLSGHGSHEPEPETLPPGVLRRPNDSRQTFLPCDIGNWTREGMTVTNSIRDYELRLWAEKILARGADVCLILDACHSGGSLRSDVGRPKALSPSELGVPPSKKPDKPADNSTEPPKSSEGAGRLATLTACEEHELAWEYPLPPDAKEAKEKRDHGLFTWFLCQELLQAATPETHRELVENVRRRLAAAHLRLQTPQAAFAQDRVFLGSESKAPAPFKLVKDEDKWTVNAGLLRGLGAGTILDVLSVEPGKDSKVLGQVRIVRAGDWDAEVEPEGKGGRDWLDHVPKDNRCRVRSLQLGDLRPKLAWSEEAAKKLPAEMNLVELEKKLVGFWRFVKPAAGKEEADWIVEVPGGKLVARRRLPLAVSAGTAKEELVFDTVPLDTPNPLLVLLRIARAEVLRTLAARFRTSAGKLEDRDNLDLLVDISFKDDKGKDVDLSKPIAKGTALTCEVFNRSGRAMIYPTVLMIDGDYRIHQLRPRPGAPPERLGPDQGIIGLKLTPGSRPCRESILVIASAEQERIADFSWLTDDTASRGPDDPIRGRTRQTPLGKLLDRYFYETASRGTVTTTGPVLMDVQNWRVRK